MSRIENVNRILRNLQTGTPEVQACALVSDDGLMIASSLPQHMDETQIAGMTATISTLGTRVATELECGDVQMVTIRASDGYAVMVQASESTCLLVMTSKIAKLGLIFLDSQRAARKLAQLL